MKKYFFCAILLCQYIFNYGQFMQNNELANIIDTIEKHHIGYSYFHVNNPKYKKFKQKILKTAITNKTMPVALHALQYLDFYKDNHTFIYTMDTMVNNLKNIEGLKSEKELIGLWKDVYSDRIYNFSKKANGDLCIVKMGFVDSLKIVKYSRENFTTIFPFKNRYYLHNYFIKNNIIYSSGKPFLKKIIDKKKVIEPQIFSNVSFYNEKISDSLYYLGIGVLKFSYAKTYDSILSTIHTDLIKSKYIIIDLRANSGGTWSVIEPLYKYAYDGKPLYPMEGYIQPTIESIEEKIAFLNGGSLNKKDSINYLKSINNDKLHLNSVYKEIADTFVFQKQFEKIEKIFILQNRHTSSAGELFILAMKNSSKVITIGENTKGIVDYGNIKLVEWNGIGVCLSTCMLSHTPIKSLDISGIPPDLKFNNISDLDATIEFLMKKYK